MKLPVCALLITAALGRRYQPKARHEWWPQGNNEMTEIEEFEESPTDDLVESDNTFDEVVYEPEETATITEETLGEEPTTMLTSTTETTLTASSTTSSTPITSSSLPSHLTAETTSSTSSSMTTTVSLPQEGVQDHQANRHPNLRCPYPGGHYDIYSPPTNLYADIDKTKRHHVLGLRNTDLFAPQAFEFVVNTTTHACQLHAAGTRYAAGFRHNSKASPIDAVSAMPIRLYDLSNSTLYNDTQPQFFPLSCELGLTPKLECVAVGAGHLNRVMVSEKNWLFIAGESYEGDGTDPDLQAIPS